MKLFAVLATVAVLASLAVAEDNLPIKVVRVTGTSEVKVVPDRAVIEVGVEKQAASASVAKHAEDAVARRILASLRANGVEEKDIQTTYICPFSLVPSLSRRFVSLTLPRSNPSRSLCAI
jgi:uncharacterized protein